MTHYSKEQWKLYSNNLIEENQALEMQEHLLECEHCFEIYLEFISRKSEVENISFNENFTDNIMKLIKDENKNELRIEAKSKRKSLIVSYIAASSITLFLMWSGVFQYILGAGPESRTELASTGMKKESIFASGWTDKLTNGTSKLVNNLDIKEFSFKNIKFNNNKSKNK